MAAALDLDVVTAAEQTRRGRYRQRVMVCQSISCLAAGAQATRTAIEQATDEEGLGHDVQVVPTGCMGLCSRGPLAQVVPRGGAPTLYGDVTAEAGRQLVASLPRRAPPPPAAVTDRVLDPDMPFFACQRRFVLANAGRIDPERIEDYVAEGGYRAMQTALQSMAPDDVIEAIAASGLRGRGGAGYPTAKKWRLLAAAGGEHKYVVANGDEGDPGAFMDRTVMEDDPHRVLEGIALAAYATGADRAFLYVRAEFARAVERLDAAIRAARRHRLLGRRVLGSDFSLDVSVRIGAGAFVCGEETALMASVEGGRGTPRLRPPYPTEQGLWGAPTVINNVETLANVPGIIGRGPEAFAAIGTSASNGTKVFALAGSLVNTGLIEVPMGITLRQIVEDVGGGIAGGRAFKAAQTGGPSGGCIPAELLDTPMDYERLQALGSIMGSGGLIVMDDSVTMPEVARYFMEFCRDESCGKCVPCRAGTVQLVGLLDRICTGAGTTRDLAQLESLGQTVRETSLCGLGQTAPNPLFSTLEHFRGEYLDLLVDGDTAGGEDG
ncbi:MAG: NADH-ubiquinone oxidoreductase-F iron-sulfur binding region domain-containing protein [Egibacteraceae bacterium]